MYFKFIIFFLLAVSFWSCGTDPLTEKEKKAYEQQSLLSMATDGNVRSDCVYCSNTQAFQGSCSCYQNIPVFSCAGIPSGGGKSNSYKISCSNLTKLGIWAKVSANAYSCTYLTCPPEAYRAAFTEGQ
ncbi:hypothetical protein EHQ53_09840 [Leptospira langatensis]|uniref:Lipoprotein n=1 Tax=Leptospira langatensis TaxID=2484983 RepID=A0A5F1ZV32_9LEPT|nr:hypothetical protein [Leptospira langatensis]TGK00263.1 hypothetical protein EHO57_13350 [Leptospira langatensis]TGL41102.1 hypothetical protein EHQ53_09840 [Leptospira langatensis]